MGWTGCSKPAGMSPLRFILSEWEGEWMAKQGLAVVASAEANGEVYIALKVNSPSEWERSIYEIGLEGSVTVALVYLFEQGTGPCGFRYKQMDESMGPYCSACPLSVLSKLSPLKAGAPGFAATWRKRQKAYSMKEAA